MSRSRSRSRSNRCRKVVVRRECCNNGFGGNGFGRRPGGIILGIAVLFLLLGRNNRSC
ncbi:MAG TPA: hypothetical protein VIK72_05695 [Clostridiaceae bacterium]